MDEEQLDDDTDIGMESETQGDEEDSDDDPGSSPSLSAASTPPYISEDGFFSFSKKPNSNLGKPLNLRRRRGRPKKEFDKKPLGIKLKRWKSGLYVKRDSTSCSQQPRTPNSAPDTPQSQKSPLESGIVHTGTVLENECKELVVNLGEKVEKVEKTEKPFPMLAPDDPPYFPETWPGKICALCNLSERSQLGQREMIRLSCPEGFTPRKPNPSPGLSPPSVQNMGDKSPRGQIPHQVSHRRQKSREGKSGTEILDELSVVGYVEEPDINLIFEQLGTFYVHLSCILWSEGVSRNESDLQIENHGPVVLQALSRRCSYCSRFGASVMCNFAQGQSCGIYFHYPCALASGAFMDNKTKSLICNLHLDQVPLLPIGETSQCSTCLSLGNVSNILMCTSCGAHHHGSCVGLALLPGVRAGWQCFECRVCQVCRQPSEIGKIMLCESCDKAYHPSCLRPIVTSIPKYGWKCKCCRVCSDCGSRTPGSGLSSRWHNHFSVCDSCYQQRNKGYCCPICGRAYRAAAHREMVQCNKCRKYVHGSCDNDADLGVYASKKEANPDYEYVCCVCKNLSITGRQAIKRKDSFDEALIESSLSASQESLYADDSSGMEVDHSPSDGKNYEDYPRTIGLGKGKPFCSSNLAKKRFMSRPKGQQAGGKINYQKMKKMPEFGKKRGIKTKMRGVFGVPGLGLQKPQADPSSKSEEEPGVENRMVLCSGSDKFVLSQDICVMCGALGTDQEGCLIACAQCGQCYHPYCVNVKVTKVILQKGWRCLDCTVCEGCGQRNDDSRLTLCDDCDISYHIYCMDPPLDYVPRGVWKCKWCVVCVRCGSNDPGFNCNWMNGYTECGPCASHTFCPSCLEPYSEGELVIQCEQCERWLHGSCDGIRNELDAEKCADEKYTCVLCRPRDVPPPHLLPPPPPPKPIQKPPTPTKSPELPRFSQTQFLVDGVCLSEAGMLQIKSLVIEQQGTQRKKRSAKRIASLLPSPVMDKEARFLATIESVVSGTEGKSPAPPSPGVNADEDGMKDENMKEEPTELWKEGMEVTPREDGKPPEPPEGFTIVTLESGVMVLRKKRTRNLQKLGIGGFWVRFRSNRKADDEEDPSGGEKPPVQSSDKPKRKPVRRKARSKLVESFPTYLQEAFFGRELLDTPKEKELHSSSEDEAVVKFEVTDDKTIELSMDELKVMEDVKAKQEKEKEEKQKQKAEEKLVEKEKSPIKTEEDEGSDNDVLKDLNLKDLPLPGDLLDTDLVNTIMAEDDIKAADNLDAGELNGTLEPAGASQPKDELADILSPHFNLETMVRESGLPNMNSKDVEEIFKGVLTDENQEGQQGYTGLHLNVQPPLTPQNIIPSSFPPPSPYHSEYSNSPHSQVSEPASPWLEEAPMGVDAAQGSGGQAFTNSRTTPMKMEADEALGLNATISSVLYANTNHPEWKKQYPVWPERCKQILKKWRSLTSDQKAPYLQKARDNRSAVRMKKTQQIPKESPTSATSPSGNAVAKGSPSAEQKSLIPTTVSQQLAGEGEVCEAAASNQAALETQSLTTNTPPSPPTTSTITITTTTTTTTCNTSSTTTITSTAVAESDTRGTCTPNSDEHYCAPTTPIDLNQAENISVKNPPTVENKAVRVLLAPVDNTHNRSQNILLRNVVIANNSSIVNPNHNFTIHHHFSGASSNQYVQNEPIIIAGQTQAQQTNPFNVQNILGQNNSNVIQFPNYTRFPSQLHLDISNRAPNVTIRAFETGGLSHLTRNQISSHGQAFIHRPMTLTLPHNQRTSHISEIKILHSGSNILHTAPQVVQSQHSQHGLETANQLPIKNEETDKILSSDVADGSRMIESKELDAASQGLVEQTGGNQEDKMMGYNRLLIVSDSTCQQQHQQAKSMEPKVPQKDEEKEESSEPNDHQIRVLTPSEIMRTLPSLGPDGYDLVHPSQTTSPVPSNHSHMDQEKVLQQQKANRESEQERHWKQLQALRQAQAQQQQQVIQEQRAQGIARINRQMSGGEDNNPNLTLQLQVSTTQDTNTLGPLASSSPGSRSQFPPNSNVKVTRIHPGQSPSPFSHPLAPPSPLLNRPIRPQGQTFQSRQFSPNQTSSIPDFPGTPSPNSETDPYMVPRTFANQSPRAVFAPQSPRPQTMPPRPTVMFSDGNRRSEESFPPVQTAQSPEVTRQLRDLLQRQKESNPPSPAMQQRQQWPSGAEQYPEGQDEGTFRHPLPPGNIPRPRIPVQQVLVRAPLRPISDPRMQAPPDQRMRLLIQQQRPQSVQAFITQPSQPRTNIDPYDEMVQQRHAEGSVLQQRLVPVRIRPGSGSGPPGIHVVPPQQPAPNAEQQEIPESVTAELEQLEQEGGQIAEVEAVSAILGDLADDDDELLAEMGADFNILEYVDTETSHGDKTNILDNLELEDEETKEKRLLKETSGGKPTPTKPIPQIPRDNAVKSALVAPPVNPEVPIHAPKPTDAPQVPNDIPLSHITNEDLQTESLESRFQTAMPRVAMTLPGPIPVSVDPQRLPLRVGGQNSTRVIVGPSGQIIQSLPVQTRIGTIGVPPPPPPYPGPPPPYPGPQMPPGRHPVALMYPQEHAHLHLQRRPLLLQEQPLLLEDLLEQEKREQEKQQQSTDSSHNPLGDVEIDHLRGDVQPSMPPSGMVSPAGVLNPGIRPQFQRPPGPYMAPNTPRSISEAPPPSRVPPFNAPVLQPPPVPPDVITTEQDRQAAIEYETWLNNQNHILQKQLKYYETEVQKLRKVRKSLNSKQRQLRKNGNELSEQDALELQRISTEQSGLQKHLDASRKSCRQHGMLIQEYRNKQQKQRQNSPLHASSSPLNQPSHSPLHSAAPGSLNPSQNSLTMGGQTTSPMHNTNFNASSHPNTPQSPLMSPSPSPLQSPGPVISQSPGGGVLQSPMSPHSMQQSPRLGTPHSQGEESPFSPGSLPSPGPVRLASPQNSTAGNPRLASPQHRGRIVNSPGLQEPVNRLHGINVAPRYARPQMGSDTRLRGPNPQPAATVYQGPNATRVIYTQKPAGQDQTQVLQRAALTREQVMPRNILIQQQQQQLRNQQILNQISQQNPNLTMEQKQKLLQFHQQKQQLLIQQRQQLIDQQMIQQQQQLAAQNQQRIIQNQPNIQNVPISPPQRITVVQSSHGIHGISQVPQNSPRSPIVPGQNPKSPISPMIQMPQSPMNLPPKSPVTPTIQKSPMVQSQTSPLVQSPLNLPPRSPNVGSPLNKLPGFISHGGPEGMLTQHSGISEEEKMDTTDLDHGGGGPNAPIPFSPFIENIRKLAHFGLGLRGGSPMWTFNKGKKQKKGEDDRRRGGNTADAPTEISTITVEKPLQGIIKNPGYQRVVRPTRMVHPEPSTSRAVSPPDNRRISVLRHRKDPSIELSQQGIVVQLQSSQQLQLQPSQQKLIIQQIPGGNIHQKNFPLQKNLQLIQSQKLMQKKAGSPQIMSKRASLVCVDYDSLDEETPPASPSHRIDKGEQKSEKLLDDKTEEEEEEIRIATDAEGLELLTQENLLNLELEESDEGNGRRVIIIDNSGDGATELGKFDENPNGSPTVMEFLDDDLMVYEPIEGVISDSDELVVLEECEVLEAHEIDITNCEVMEFESVDDGEGQENEDTLQTKEIEELRISPGESKLSTVEEAELKEISEDHCNSQEEQKQQIIVRHTRKGKQIVMVKRGQEGKDQRHVIYRSDKGSKEFAEGSVILSRSSSEEEKNASENDGEKEVNISLKDASEDEFKKLIEQSEIIIMNENEDLRKDLNRQNPVKLETSNLKCSMPEKVEKKRPELDNSDITSGVSDKFADSPLSPDPSHDKVLSPVKIVISSEPTESNLNLPDPRLFKSSDKIKSIVTAPIEPKSEETSPGVSSSVKRVDTTEPSKLPDIPVTNLPFTDLPEGLASKFFSETRADISPECNKNKIDEPKFFTKELEGERKKDSTFDQTSVIKAPKTYEKSKLGKSKVQLSEHDYTHIPGKVEVYKKIETEEKNKPENVLSNDASQITSPNRQHSAPRIVSYPPANVSQITRKLLTETDHSLESPKTLSELLEKPMIITTQTSAPNISRPLATYSSSSLEMKSPRKYAAEFHKKDEGEKQNSDLSSTKGMACSVASRSTNLDSKTDVPVPSEISSHIAKIDPKVRDIISISKITTPSKVSEPSAEPKSSQSRAVTLGITTGSNALIPSRMTISTPPASLTKTETYGKPKVKAEETKKNEGRRKSLENVSRKKSVEERRRSSEAISRENKRELEQRKQMILEEIKQSQLEKEKLKSEAASAAPSAPETKTESPKTEHDLSDVIDILENIDNTPTRLLNASELQSIEKTQLFENEELEKAPTPPKAKPTTEPPKFDEKINLHSLLSDTGKSDIQVSDLARGSSKTVSQPETRTLPPPTSTQSKLAALLTAGSDAVRSKLQKEAVFSGSTPVLNTEIRKESVSTLEALLEKDVPTSVKTEQEEKSESSTLDQKETEDKPEVYPEVSSPKSKPEVSTSACQSENLILSPTSGIFRSSSSNLGVPAAKILSSSAGIALASTETSAETVAASTESETLGTQGSSQTEQKAIETARQVQGITVNTGQLIQQNTLIATSIAGQQGILINDRNLITTVGNSPGVLMTTRLIQPVPKSGSSPNKTSTLSALPPGIRQQIITANYIQQNRANPVLVRRISTPSPPRARTPPQTQAHLVQGQSTVVAHPGAIQLESNAQRVVRPSTQVTLVTAAATTTSGVNVALSQSGLRLTRTEIPTRLVVSTGSQLIASTQLQRLSVSQALSIPSAVMSTSVTPSTPNAEKSPVENAQTTLQRSLNLDSPNRSQNQAKIMATPNPEAKYSSQEMNSSQVNLSVVKTEPVEVKEEKCNTYSASTNSNNKFPRTDESQNVLLKQLLQNTACAGPPPPTTTTTTTAPLASQPSSSPVLATVPSLEAQLARPVPPTPSALIPSILSDQKPAVSAAPVNKPARPIPGKELQKTAVAPAVTTAAVAAAASIEGRRISQSNRTPSREDLLSPTNSTRSSFGLRTPSPITSPQATIKQEKPQQGLLMEADIKKEIPEEPPRSDSSSNDRASQEQAAIDLKKLKRRQYQQKRRQSQGKEGLTGGTPKKRARKGSRMEEDYETYTENLMTQLRQLPALNILEPVLGKNFNVCSVFGSGDHSKVANAEIKGSYGNCFLPNSGDYYTAKPFGEKEKPPPSSPLSTQRGFYDQEFSVINLVNDSEEKKLEALLLGSRERDTDTPDTIVSSSSPESMFYERTTLYPALQLIKEEVSSDEEMRASPPIPIIAPIPVRLKPGQTLKEFKEIDKENSCAGANLKKNAMSVKDGNVTVTLTLNSDAAQDILSVLKDLANILHIPAPTNYQIIERTTTPPSIKLGLYRNKGKDGKEGAPVDIQSILNGQAKFCRHCDVVILNNMIRKKVMELPFLSQREDIPDNTEDLFFCSSSCYIQFSLMHKSPSIGQEKAAAVVDHLSENGSAKKIRLITEEKENAKEKSLESKKEIESKKPNKGNKYKYWQPGSLIANTRYKRPTERELMEMLFRVGVTLTPSQNSDDTRRCLFCHQVGDGVADGPARLLNFDVDKWVHLNCALWSDDVYETVNGALMNVDNALQLGQTTTCSLCNQNGATIHCFKLRCSNVYHLGCAVKDECVFFKNKTAYCPAHVPKNEKDNELTTLSVYRRVYVQRDENRQVATVMHHTDQNHLLRVGSLIFLNVGQLLPHQLSVFHTPNYIYPVGYKILRFYWSMRRPNKRCKYICSIHDAYGRPEFRILVQEPNYDDIELRDSSPKAVWARILEPLQQLRKENGNVQIFPRYVSGEDLFGLNEPAVVRVLESLPGVETLTDYKFKYGRNPLLELPLAVNPTGCARSEPRQKNLLPYKRPHTQRTATTSRPNLFASTMPGLSSEVLCPYSKQFVHSKSSQYKKMKLEWRNNVYLARSKIQGLGLYAARDLERHTMVIEYIGEIIRHELSESREKQYEARNRGIYMFRLDEERVIDATICGGLARYINHSCNPNCVAEIVEVDRDLRIIIFAKRRISRGEELAYDYKFDIEDDQHKIPCLCGAPNCRKWMN